MRDHDGGVAEWSMAAVLKTVGRQRPGGSNPSASAKERQLVAKATGCFWSPARRKLAFTREGGREQPVGTTDRQLPSTLCKDSPPRDSASGRRTRRGIPPSDQPFEEEKHIAR